MENDKMTTDQAFEHLVKERFRRLTNKEKRLLNPETIANFHSDKKKIAVWNIRFKRNQISEKKLNQILKEFGYKECALRTWTFNEQ